MFSSIFGKKPRSRDELETICNHHFSEGNPEKAVKAAIDFQKFIWKNDNLTRQQKDLNVAYAWCIAAKGSYRQIVETESQRVFETYRAYFFCWLAAERSFSSAFISLGATVTSNDGVPSEHLDARNANNALYNEIYEKFGDDPDMQRADIAASDLIRNMMSP